MYDDRYGDEPGDGAAGDGPARDEAPLAGWEDAELTGRVVAIERERACLDAEQVGLLAEIDERGFLRRAGWRSIVGWLTQRAQMSGRDASAKMRAAHALPQLPAVEAALAAGDLCFEKVSALTREYRPATAALLAADAPLLVKHALSLPVDRFRREMQYWNEAATQELEREPEAAAKDQYFHFSQTWGAWFGSLKLTGDDGVIVAGALEEIARELHDDFRRDTALDPTLDPQLFAAQLRALALTEMARRAMSWDPQYAKYREPAFTIVIPLADLNARLGATTEAEQWIPGDTIRRLGCSGTLTPVIVESLANPKPLDVGRAQRLPSYEQRRAVIARDRHCRFPGCDVAANRCEQHHLIPWDDGHGPTNLDNLALYCRRHHHLGHEGGWNYSGNSNELDGITHQRPDGTILNLEYADSS